MYLGITDKGHFLYEMFVVHLVCIVYIKKAQYRSGAKGWKKATYAILY